MSKLNTAIIAGVAAIGLAGGAVAQDDGHFYIQGFGGANWVEDMDLSETDSRGPTSSGSIDFDTGYGVGAAVGYDFGDWRVEGEVSWRDNDVDGVTNPFVASATGDVTALAIMANAYFDFHNDSAFTPYLGAGIGAGLVDLSVTTQTTFGPTATFQDDGWGFAAQGIVGAGYEVADNVELFAEGRVLAIFEPDLSDSNQFSNFSSAGVMDDDYVSYGVFGGLRVHFAPPPPPPVAPAPAPEPVAMPAQTDFIVFFDWDRSVLTAQANNVLDEVVVVYDANGFAQVNLAGHTDTSGPASYNVGLSERRAESVRQGLVARGVAPDEIVVRFFGETALLVPTPDGVREPQNRRVEIVLM